MEHTMVLHSFVLSVVIPQATKRALTLRPRSGPICGDMSCASPFMHIWTNTLHWTKEAGPWLCRTDGFAVLLYYFFITKLNEQPGSSTLNSHSWCLSNNRRRCFGSKLPSFQRESQRGLKQGTYAGNKANIASRICVKVRISPLNDGWTVIYFNKVRSWSDLFCHYCLHPIQMLSTSDVMRDAEVSQQCEHRRHHDLSDMAFQDSDDMSPLGTGWNI
jgi:hypothetical protein